MHSSIGKGVWAMQSKTSEIVERFKKERVSGLIQNLIYVFKMCLGSSTESNKDQ